MTAEKRFYLSRSKREDGEPSFDITYGTESQVMQNLQGFNDTDIVLEIIDLDTETEAMMAYVSETIPDSFEEHANSYATAIFQDQDPYLTEEGALGRTVEEKFVAATREAATKLKKKA